MTTQKRIQLHERNCLRIACRFAPLLETYGLTELDWYRPSGDLHGKHMPGTVVWSAARVWTTRKTKVQKTLHYIVIHWPSDTQYETMTDEEYGMEVVRQLDERLYEEGFAAVDRKKLFRDKRKFMAKLQAESGETGTDQPSAPQQKPVNTADWESF